jgi:pimeloyl-ACP methyl ester carboxylesterase
MTPEIRYIDINGAHLGYEVHSEDSGKPPAIFMHGYSGRSTGDCYSNFLPLLADEFTLYAFDARGHGASASQVEGFSFAAVADDVVAFARALGITGALYIGHSFGAFTGMYCEVRHPGTFGALCLLNMGSAEGGGANSDGAVFVEHGRDREFMVEALKSQYVRGGDPSRHAAALALMDPRIHELFYAEWPKRVIIEEVRNISIPVLALNGALDSSVPLATQHATAMAIPNCKEVIFTTQGHIMPLESPDITAREIIFFWKHEVALNSSPQQTIQSAPPG